MSRIVNLRTVRKQKKREAARRAGTAQSAASGEARALKDLRRSETERAARQLDGHRRDDPET